MPENRDCVVCFTGHRPEKLKRPQKLIQDDLEKQIRRAIDGGQNVFMTGMARGVDRWAAQIVLRLRDAGAPVKLICACPYKGFGADVQSGERDLLSEADCVEYICDAYSRACFQKRNEWMVDHASCVIAVFNGEKGGTKNTIAYAKKAHVPLVLIEG